MEMNKVINMIKFGNNNENKTCGKELDINKIFDLLGEEKIMLSPNSTMLIYDKIRNILYKGEFGEKFQYLDFGDKCVIIDDLYKTSFITDILSSIDPRHSYIESDINSSIIRSNVSDLICIVKGEYGYELLKDGMTLVNSYIKIPLSMTKINGESMLNIEHESAHILTEIIGKDNSVTHICNPVGDLENLNEVIEYVDCNVLDETYSYGNTYIKREILQRRKSLLK